MHTKQLILCKCNFIFNIKQASEDFTQLNLNILESKMMDSIDFFGLNILNLNLLRGKKLWKE